MRNAWVLLAQLVDLASSVYALGLFVYAVCIWIRHAQAQAAAKWLKRWYDPFLLPLRKAIKPVTLGKMAVDFTPMVLLLGIVIARKVLIAILLLPY